MKFKVVEKPISKDERIFFISEGRDGFYGAVAVSFQEPMIKDEVYFKTGYLPKNNKCTYSEQYKYYNRMCPIAEKVQSQLMSFKTNYRNLEEAKNQVLILQKTIKKFN